MQEFLFTEKYRPKTISDTILPERLKQAFQSFVDQKNIPNLLLAGGPGCGKTTVARAMLEELGCSYMIINGSLEGNIDTLRTQIKDFASSYSLKKDGRKYVILDEADYLSHHTQPALRNFMEEYSKNCGFILTCNYKNKIIEPLQSRCSLIEFKFTKEEKEDLIHQIYKRLRFILEQENISYDKKVLVTLIAKYYPDFRKLINELQKYSNASGSIDVGILQDFEVSQIKTLIEYMKNKDFSSIQKWIVEADYDEVTLYRKLYDNSFKFVDKSTIPVMVLILAKYQYQAAFCADHEINTLACLVELMSELKFV